MAKREQVQKPKTGPKKPETGLDLRTPSGKKLPF